LSILGFLLQWPTILTLATFPVLVFMYVRLARAEEREALAEFGPAYERYMREVPTFIPRLGELSAIASGSRDPFPAEQAIREIESGLGRPIGQMFGRFDRQPLAAASIAQVHAAQLADGRNVVVKVTAEVGRSLIDGALAFAGGDWARRRNERAPPQECCPDWRHPRPARRIVN
jgi:hypothetical protein